MTLDEAIRHAEEVAEKNEEIYEAHCRIYSKEVVEKYPSPPCKKCAEEHRQLAEWLKELKAHKEQSGDAISRNDVIDTLNNMHRYIADELTLCSTGEKFEGNEVFIVDDVYEEIAENLPSVNSQPIKCDDAISRREALNAITMAEVRWQAVDNVNKLPSVTPQPCGDTISRAYIEPIIEELENICVKGDEHILDLLADIKNAPSGR